MTDKYLVCVAKIELKFGILVIGIWFWKQKHLELYFLMTVLFILLIGIFPEQQCLLLMILLKRVR